VEARRGSASPLGSQPLGQEKKALREQGEVNIRTGGDAGRCSGRWGGQKRTRGRVLWEVYGEVLRGVVGPLGGGVQGMGNGWIWKGWSPPEKKPSRKGAKGGEKTKGR